MRTLLRGALRRLLVLAASVSFASSAHAATSPVGATAGRSQVTPTGAFTYTIPLAVPPGTAGMQPNLSLTYNSQGGNGLIGMGWSLSGLSAIHRCPKTLVQDGIKGGINLDTNDRYCLDGQRLVAISGSYGGSGTEYRTETESYSRIISYGSQGNGPAYWKVWTKSGQIMEYGATQDSFIEAQGQTTALVWALDKVSDTVGNYLTVTYTEDNTNGQYYPTRIDYAGNANTGKAPGNSVQFTYETRPDSTPDNYVAGTLVKTTMRLTNVKSFTGTSVVREYRLTYDNTGTPNTSLLSTLTECAGDGVCLPATSFAWQRSIGGLQMTSTPSWTFAPTDMGYQNFDLSANPLSLSPEAENLLVADVNGDGMDDWVYLKGGKYLRCFLLGPDLPLRWHGVPVTWGLLDGVQLQIC